MADYKELYFRLFRATEEAIQLLIAAQRDCEERYLSALEPELTLFSSSKVSDQEEDGGAT